MGLRLDKAPSSVRRRVRTELRRWVLASPQGHHIRENMHRGRLIGPVAVGSLENYGRGGRKLGASWRRTAWSYLMLRNGEAVGIVDLAAVGTAAVKIFSIHHAETAGLWMKALSCAEDQVAHRYTDYTVRYVGLPHLHTACFWLAARESLFILIHESGETHSVPRIATEQEFATLIRERARELRRYARASRVPKR
jgi:hypothetical protein